MNGIEILQFMWQHNGVFWGTLVVLGSGLWVGWHSRDLWKRVSAIEQYIVDHNSASQKGFDRVDKLEAIAERLDIIVGNHDKEIYALREAKHDVGNKLMAVMADVQNLKGHKR